MTVQPVKPQVPKPTGGLIFWWSGWRNSPKGRHVLYVLAHLLLVMLAVAYVVASFAVTPS